MREMIYFGDTMCSWCWGFAPVVTQLRDKYQGRVKFTLSLGGLRPGDLAEPMNDKTKRYIKHHWHEVAKATGQPFKYDFFEWNDFVYDTEPASKAVRTMREISPEHEFDFFKEVQHAFYAENLNVTTDEVLYELAQKYEIDMVSFKEVFNSEDLKKNTYREFYSAAQLGVTGFPTILFQEDGKYMYLTRGYQPFENLDQYVEAFATSGFAAAAQQ